MVYTVTIVFFGLRGHILTDFSVYYYYFEFFNYTEIFTSNGLFEPGFIFFTYICKLIWDNYFFWVFVSSVVHIFALTHLFKKYIGNISIGLIFFLGYRGIIVEFNLMQNFISILLFLYSIPFLQKRKLLPYLLLNLLGMTFHITSIIYIPLYFVLNREVNKKWAILIVLISNMFFLGGSEALINVFFWLVSVALPSTFEDYLYFFLDINSYGITFGYLERTLMIILIIYFGDRIKSEIKHGVIWYNLALFYYSFFLLLSPIDVLTDRIPILFLSAFWVLPACLLFFNNKFRQVIAALLIVLSFAKLVLSTRDPVARYDNLLFGITPFEERFLEVEEFLDDNL